MWLANGRSQTDHRLAMGMNYGYVFLNPALSLKRRLHTAPLDTATVLLIYYLQRKTLHYLSGPFYFSLQFQPHQTTWKGGVNGKGGGKTWVHDIILCKRKLYSSKKIQNACNKVLHPNCRPISFIRKSLNENSLSF